MSSSLYSIMAQSNTGSDWNWFLIFLIFVVVLAVALIIQARFSRSTANQFDTHPEEDHHEPAEAAPPTPAQPEPEPEPQAEPEPAAPAEPDDLKKLEGIGPKVAGLLNQNGITSFAQLAATPVEELEKILDANKLQMMHPGSWPQQAKLAADGNWEALQTMQDELKGGR